MTKLDELVFQMMTRNTRALLSRFLLLFCVGNGRNCVHNFLFRTSSVKIQRQKHFLTVKTASKTTDQVCPGFVLSQLCC